VGLGDRWLSSALVSPPGLQADGKPALSVILITDGLATVERTLRHLASQSIAGQIEIVLVAQRGTIEPDAEQLRPFWGSQVAEVDSIVSESWAWVREPGIRAARADVVVLAESHAFPLEGWAEALLRAHQGPWAAVGPAMTNANPRFAASWANMLVDYGPFAEPEQGREEEDLPGHNSSYKREVLDAYGPELRQLLEAEYFLHADLRRRGERLWLEPEARIAHLFATRARPWLIERIAAGRRFAWIRAASWTRRRRLAYSLGAPLIPLVRLARTIPIWGRIRRRHRLPRLTLPVTVLGFALSAVGEFLGYAIGTGKSSDTLYAIELYRERYLRPGETPPEPESS
jgi:glycosyl transferase family 2